MPDGTIIFDLGLPAPRPCHSVAHDMQSEMSVYRRLLAVYICLLANMRVF
jgi:hypothetical protein